MENHEKSSSFDIKICVKCFCQQSVIHDCIKSSLESKEKLDKRILELENELISAKDEINSLKSELERASNSMALPSIPNWAPNSNRPSRPNWSTRHPRPTWHHGSSRGTRPNFPNTTPSPLGPIPLMLHIAQIYTFWVILTLFPLSLTWNLILMRLLKMSSGNNLELFKDINN